MSETAGFKPAALSAALNVPLPEVILKKKWAGDLQGAASSIDAFLAGDLPDALRARLLAERERILRLPTQYPWDKQEALEKLHELLPALTEEDFDRLESEGRIDFIYLNGEKRYFVRFHKCLARAADVQLRCGQAPDPASPWLDRMMAVIKKEGKMSLRLTVEASVGVDEQAFVPGTYLVHLPFPLPCAQQSDIELLEGSPDGVNPPDSDARCLWWREDRRTPEPWRACFRYVSAIRYADPLHAPAPESPLYPAEQPVSPEDLSEAEPWLRFTPLLRSIAAEITAGCSEPAEKAWAAYRYVTTKVKYSYMRDYFQIDDLGEFCAVNGFGDCGLQALLFILLCRISGVPARWQSGRCIEEDGSLGCHDWAQFWLEGWGWLFADPSFGGSAWRSGNQERHAFYFGNLDPMRIVSARSFQAPLTPERTQLRVDPYDNQSGEVERLGAALPFTGRDLTEDGRLIACEQL